MEKRSRRKFTKEFKAAVPGETKYSHPYWLRQPATVGTFTVEDQDLRPRQYRPRKQDAQDVCGGENLSWRPHVGLNAERKRIDLFFQFDEAKGPPDVTVSA